MPTSKSKDRKMFWTTLPGILTGIAAVITAIGGLLVGLNSAGLLAPKPTETPVKREWAIPFRHEFPVGFWNEGSYDYAIDAICPGTNSNAKGSQSFKVSKVYSYTEKEIFIRYTGLYSDSQSTSMKFDGFHPDQKTVASYTVIAQNESDIVKKTNVCTVTFNYNQNGQPSNKITLTPSSAIPYP